jgi:hypothetical protein
MRGDGPASRAREALGGSWRRSPRGRRERGTAFGARRRPRDRRHPIASSLRWLGDRRVRYVLPLRLREPSMQVFERGLGCRLRGCGMYESLDECVNELVGQGHERRLDAGQSRVFHGRIATAQAGLQGYRAGQKRRPAYGKTKPGFWSSPLHRNLLIARGQRGTGLLSRRGPLEARQRLPLTCLTHRPRQGLRLSDTRSILTPLFARGSPCRTPLLRFRRRSRWCSGAGGSSWRCLRRRWPSPSPLRLR